MGLVNVADNCKPCSWGWTVREFTRPGAVDNFRHRNFSICLKNVGFMAISMEGYKPRNFKKNRCSCRLKICPYFWITTLIWNGHNFKVQFLWNSPIKRFQKHLKSPLHTCESWYLSKNHCTIFFVINLQFWHCEHRFGTLCQK